MNLCNNSWTGIKASGYTLLHSILMELKLIHTIFQTGTWLHEQNGNLAMNDINDSSYRLHSKADQSTGEIMGNPWPCLFQLPPLASYHPCGQGQFPLGRQRFGTLLLLGSIQEKLHLIQSQHHSAWKISSSRPFLAPGAWLCLVDFQRLLSDIHRLSDFTHQDPRTRWSLFLSRTPGPSKRTIHLRHTMKAISYEMLNSFFIHRWRLNYD